MAKWVNGTKGRNWLETAKLQRTVHEAEQQVLLEEVDRRLRSADTAGLGDLPGLVVRNSRIRYCRRDHSLFCEVTVRGSWRGEPYVKRYKFPTS